MMTHSGNNKSIMNGLNDRYRRLAELMSDISERTYFAVWLLNLEYDLWHAIYTEKYNFTKFKLNADDATLLCQLSKECGSWIVYVEGFGLLPVPLEEWDKHCANRENNPLSLYRYTMSPRELVNPPMVGVLFPDEFNSSIKNKLLLMDKIVVTGFPEDFEERPGIPVAYLDKGSIYLHSDGIKPYLSPGKPWLSDKDFTLCYELSRQASQQCADEAELLHKINTSVHNNRALLRRLAAAQLQRIHGLNAIPCLADTESFFDYKSENKAVVLSIVMNSVGILDGSVSYEDIKAFKNDEDNYNRLLALRAWISDVSKGEINPGELCEKIEFLINEHNKALKAHEMKHSSGAFEAIVVTTAEVAEDLLKLKFGKIASAAFSLFNSNTSLLEAEMKSPGAQLAYVVRANTRFSA